MGKCGPEAGDKGGLAAERAHHLHTAQHLLQVGILQTDRLTARPFGVADPHLEISGYPHDWYCCQRCHQRQERAEGHQGRGDRPQPDYPHQDRGPARPPLSAS